ncbi:hypothetical protein ERO13_D11G003900v2 [Gossypium hirsutum]|nr:hypothetical protein ERO13_D11G003900v2 [Gossypium hirsutum]
MHLFHSHSTPFSLTFHSILTLIGILRFTTMVHEYELRVRADLPPNLKWVGPTEEWSEIGTIVQVVCNNHDMPAVDSFYAYGRPWRTHRCSCGSELYFKVRSIPPLSRLCFNSEQGVVQVQILKIDFPSWAGHDYSMSYDSISTEATSVDWQAFHRTYGRSLRLFQLEYAESYYVNDGDEHLYTAKLEVVRGRDQNTGEEIVENVGTGRFYFKWKSL